MVRSGRGRVHYLHLGLKTRTRGAVAVNARVLDCAAGIEWRDWDGEIVVYVGARASTHLLSAQASRIFLILANRPIATSDGRVDLVDSASKFQLAVDPADDQAFIEQTLLEFERLGLARKL